MEYLLSSSLQYSGTMPSRPNSTNVDAMVSNRAYRADANDDAGILRCSKCNSKLQFCVCGVRRGTLDMANADGRRTSNAQKDASDVNRTKGDYTTSYIIVLSIVFHNGVGPRV